VKRLFLIVALGIVIWFVGKASQWSRELYENGAVTGSAVAEMQTVFAQREQARAQSTRYALRVMQEHKEQALREQRADQAAHKAVLDEIERLRKQEHADSAGSQLR
jgi:hypothetical protein